MRGWASARESLLRHPVQLVPLALLGSIAVATAALMLPAARTAPGHAPFLTALFTATSAVCVGGLTVVDNPQYWTSFGDVIITVATQLGGFGVTSMAVLLTLLVTRRLELHSRLVLQAETSGMPVGHVTRLLVRIALVALISETVITLSLAGRLWLTYDYPPGRALWYGLYHAIQAYNNCGFTLFEGSLTQFVGDAWICLPITFGVIVGSTGFPVLFELWERWRRPSFWTLHTRLTVAGSLVLLAVGFLAILSIEWANPRTLGPLGLPDKLLAAFVQGTMPRTGGFSSVDYGAMREETAPIVTALMFIGGGSAGTAGGIKVTTFFLLAFVIWAEIRGEPDVVIGRRRISEATQRQALTIALLGVALSSVSTLLLTATTSGIRFYQALFEVVSALSTTGLSTGITSQLSAAGEVNLIVLLFIGRLGTVAAASALALNTRHRLYRYPEERPIIG